MPELFYDMGFYVFGWLVAILVYTCVYALAVDNPRLYL